MKPRLILIHVVATALMMTWPAGGQTLDFHEALLSRGLAASREGRHAEAAQSLRIAAFGLLDRPGLLLQALVPLYLTYEHLGQDQAAEETLERILVVESRFGVWQSTDVEAEQREQFLARAAARAGRERLSGIPAFATRAPAEDGPDSLANLSGTERRRALEAAARSAPRNATYPLMLASDASAAGDHDGVIRWTTEVLALRSDDADARLMRGRSYAARGDCEAAVVDFDGAGLEAATRAAGAVSEWFLCLVELGRNEEALALALRMDEPTRSTERVAKALAAITPAQAVAARDQGRPRAGTERPAGEGVRPERARMNVPAAEVAAEARREIAAGAYAVAEKRLYEAVQVSPSNRELRLLLLEAATLAKDFRTAAAQIPLAAPFGPGEENYAFYAAVSAYETGRREQAREFLAVAKDRIRSRPWVDYYVRRIETGN